MTKLGKNQRLRSDKEIEADKASKQAALASVNRVPLRIRVPDQMSFMVEITRQESPAWLYSTVRQSLADDSLQFKLQCLGPQAKAMTLDPESQQSLIMDMGIKGAAVVTMIWDDSLSAAARNKPVLKAEMIKGAQELKAPVQKTQEDEIEQTPTPKPETTKKQSGSRVDKEAKFRKLLGLNKK